MILSIDNQRRSSWMAVIGGIIAGFMSIIDIQITNAAINQIQVATHAPLADGSWVSSSYLIAEIIGIPMTNFWLIWLGERRVAILFCILFIAGSLLCAQAGNLEQLIVYRSLQGFAAGVLMALAYVIIITYLNEPHDKQLAIILFGAIVSMAPIIGPLLGGIVTSFYDWKFLFYINVPFSIIAIILLMLGLAKKSSSNVQKIKVDMLGIITIAIGLGCMQYVLEEGYKHSWFNSQPITILFIIAITALVIFTLNELIIKAPLINLRLFKNIQFTISCCGSFMGGAAMFSFFFMVPYFLTIIYNYTPLQISYIIMWIGGAQLFMLIFAKFILRVLNIYCMIAIGFFLFATSIFFWSTFSTHADESLIIISAILRGCCQTFFLLPLGVLATTSIAKDQASSASSLYNITRSLGGAIGVACMATYVNIREAWHFMHSNDQLLSYKLAFVDSFRIMTIILLITSLSFIIIWKFQAKNLINEVK